MRNVGGGVREVRFIVLCRPIAVERPEFPELDLSGNGSGWMRESRQSFSHASVAGVVESLGACGWGVASVIQASQLGSTPLSFRAVHIVFQPGGKCHLDAEQTDWVEARMGERPYRRVVVDRYSNGNTVRDLITCGHFERQGSIQCRIAINEEGEYTSEVYQYEG